jgi:hypothetical protein
VYKSRMRAAEAKRKIKVTFLFHLVIGAVEVSVSKHVETLFGVHK